MTSFSVRNFLVLLPLALVLLWSESSQAQSETYLLNVSQATVAPGSTITVSWSAPSNHSSKDWIGIFQTDSSNRVYVTYQYVPSGTSGTMSFMAPPAAGKYEFRYLLNDGFTDTTKSALIDIGTTGAPSQTATSGAPSQTATSSSSAGYSLGVSSTTVAPKSTIAVSWSAPSNHSSKDWIGIFQTDSSNRVYVTYQYVPSGTSGTLNFSAPNTLISRTYEFRYLLNDGFIQTAKSTPITVTLTPSGQVTSPTTTTSPTPTTKPTTTTSPTPTTKPTTPTPTPTTGAGAQSCPAGKQIAFPGAEGFGRCTQGGRGGSVIEITNLNDSGPGSLRACAQDASGPRTCVFRVGGTIVLGSNIRITNPFLTIAGQTAPGDGITLKDGHLSVRADDVIIRYVRVRIGSVPLYLRNTNAGGVEVRSNEGVPIKNVIVDHCSFSWSTDDMLQAVFGSDNVTFQWNIMAEALGCRKNDCDGKGMLLGYGVKNVTVHHNLFAQTMIRQPEVTQGNVDMVNNVSYDNNGQDNDLYPMHGPIHMNIVSNYYKRGPTSYNLDRKPIRITGNNAYSTQSDYYIFGNIGPFREFDALPQLAMVNQNNAPSVMRSARLDYPLVRTTDALTAYSEVLSGAGTTVPVRDDVDLRVLANVKNGTTTATTFGVSVREAEDAGGWPVLDSGTPPVDTDHDGMPDAWEASNGLNPNDVSDGVQDTDVDGYTNVEEYLNNSNPLSRS